MFSLIRSGPKILLLESSYMDALKNYLTMALKAEESPLSNALDSSGESYLIVFLVKKIKETVNVKDVEDIFIIKNLEEDFLCRVINDKQSHLINYVRSAPRIILMRVMGNVEKIIDEIKQDYNVIVDDFEEILDKSNDKGTVVAFVDKPLNKNVTLKDLYGKSLFIPEHYYSLLQSLRMHGLKYLNEGLGKKDWYELEIRIYDTLGAYNLHYERLLKIIETLELGIILGESWGKDSPRFLMTIGVYRLRFFTFYQPTYIKKLFVGLEHLEDGTRIVDYDIYFNRKKIDWQDAAEKGLRVRRMLSKKYRDEIFSNLTLEESEEILKLEEEILKTR